MKHHVEEEPWLFNAKEALEDYQVSGTAHGEKFRNSLNDSQNDGFKESDGIPPYLGRCGSFISPIVYR